MSIVACGPAKVSAVDGAARSAKRHVFCSQLDLLQALAEGCQASQVAYAALHLPPRHSQGGLSSDDAALAAPPPLITGSGV